MAGLGEDTGPNAGLRRVRLWEVRWRTRQSHMVLVVDGPGGSAGHAKRFELRAAARPSSPTRGQPTPRPYEELGLRWPPAGGECEPPQIFF